ncbi:hypothetical protein [Alcaligenes ammonioxydans]|uniref:hypothetical protein n=1 Tax=Alcaligenes ammonioxydans TaxID=2582914 RepID=UPI003D1E3BB5
MVRLTNLRIIDSENFGLSYRDLIDGDDECEVSPLACIDWEEFHAFVVSELRDQKRDIGKYITSAALATTARFGTGQAGEDKDKHSWENKPMHEHPTHRELDAKLETIESKMDARLGRLELAAKNMARANIAFRKDMKRQAEDSAKSISSLKWWLVGTAISTVIGVALGVAAFNAALTSNMVASLGSGKEAGAALEKATAQQVETQRLLREIKEYQSNLARSSEGQSTPPQKSTPSTKQQPN